uniref:Uncharacterized protein n=1 Tax=Knipowitschia caucasica TaxID=637954 RepID=A0AAV2LB07_KNICA
MFDPPALRVPFPLPHRIYILPLAIHFFFFCSIAVSSLAPTIRFPLKAPQSHSQSHFRFSPSLQLPPSASPFSRTLRLTVNFASPRGGCEQHIEVLSLHGKPRFGIHARRNYAKSTYLHGSSHIGRVINPQSHPLFPTPPPHAANTIKAPKSRHSGTLTSSRSPRFNQSPSSSCTPPSRNDLSKFRSLITRYLINHPIPPASRCPHKDDRAANLVSRRIQKPLI